MSSSSSRGPDDPTGQQYNLAMTILKRSIQDARRSGQPLEDVASDSARTIRKYLQRVIPPLAYQALDDVVHRLRRPERGLRLVSADAANDGAAAIVLDAVAKDFLKQRINELMLGLPHAVVGEGIGIEDRAVVRPGWVWFVIDPVDGSTQCERDGEGFAVQVSVFMKTLVGLERIVVAIATSPAGGSVVASAGKQAHIAWDGVDFDEISDDDVVPGSVPAVGMVTGGKPKALDWLSTLVRQLDLDVPARDIFGLCTDRPWSAAPQGGNPSLVRLLLLQLPLLIQPSMHKVYDAAFLYPLMTFDAITVLSLDTGRPMKPADLDLAFKRWIDAGCPNDLRTVDPYIVSTIPGLAEHVRESVLKISESPLV